jgi:putative ABC transport system ATP-binding protein
VSAREGRGGERTPSVPPAVIDVRQVTKVYGAGETAVPALGGVSVRVDRGDYVAIMGASGSGKSTLMNIIGCLDVPTAGSYLLDGTDAGSLAERQLAILRNRKIGFIFQSFNLIPRMSALANVELPLAYGGIKAVERRRRALAALGQVGLADRVGHDPNELSGGQQQRVAVARALVTAPSLLLADEPTGNLDTKSTRDVLSVLDRLSGTGRTIVVITHEADVAAHAARVVRLVDGQVVEDRRKAPIGAPAIALEDAGAGRGAP